MRRLALIAMLCAACSGETSSGPRLQLTHAGHAICSGVRVAPERVFTAAHCGASLSLDGEALVLEGLVGHDVAAFTAAAGEWHSIARYSSEPLRAWLQSGPHDASVLVEGPLELELDAPCRPGDSGAPVLGARGVVAIVVRANVTRDVCIAELLR